MILAGTRRSFGVLYKEYMSAYNATATEVALVMTVQLVVISILGELPKSLGCLDSYVTVCSN